MSRLVTTLALGLALTGLTACQSLSGLGALGLGPSDSARLDADANMAGAGKDAGAPDGAAGAAGPAGDLTGDLTGRRAAGLRRELGPPMRVRIEGPARIWQYRSPGCLVDLFLYPGEDGERRVFHVAHRSPRLARATAAGDGAPIALEPPAPAPSGCLDRLPAQKARL